VLALQEKIDKFAISLSFLCALHCAVLPSLWVLIPSFVTLGFDSELIHWWMLAIVIPVSSIALISGTRKHGNYMVLFMGFIGLLVLASAVILGEDFLGESGEKLVTVFGSAIVAIAHFRNYRFCRDTDCSCHNN
jgi:hypothetical protein